MSTLKERYILLLGASPDQRFIIQTAKEMGIGTVVIDANPDSVGFPIADITGVISTRDPKAIIQFVELQIKNGVPLKGISVMGSDIPDIVAEVAEHFGWASVGKDAAQLATHKFLMKERFYKQSIPIPNFAIVRSAHDVSTLWQDWCCPSVIIKPVDQAGSRGVFKIDKFEQVEFAYQQAVEAGRGGEVMLEEYIPGRQFSTETVLTKSNTMTPGFADRVYEGMEGFWPQVLENGAWVPTSLSPDEQADVVFMVEQAARALGIENGVAKGDVVVCPRRGPMMIEMAARLSGGDFSETLVPKGCGVNYVKAAIQIALGEEPNWDDLKPKFSKPIANRYFFAPSGKLEALEGVEAVKAMPELVKFDLWYKPGDTLPVIKHHGNRTGVFITQGDSREHLQSLIVKIYETVRFKIDGAWHTAAPPTPVHPI